MSNDDGWQGEIPVDGKPSPSLPQTVKLSWAQYYFAAEVGLMRWITSRQSGHVPAHGKKRPNIEEDIIAAAAEYAAAIALNEPWVMGVNTFKAADVGQFTQVRYTAHQTGSLIVREDDNTNHRYVLVTPGKDDRTFVIHGWKWGFEAREDEWRRAPNGRPPAWFVPQKELDTW